MIESDLLPPQLAQLAGARPESVALAAWKFAVSNGSLHHAGVRLDGDTVELVVGPLARAAAWDLLLTNGRLKPPSRLVLTPRDEVLLRAEVVLDGSAQDGRVVDSAVCALREGLEASEGAPSPAVAGAEPWDVEQAAAEAGIAGRLLGDGRFKVDSGAAGLRAALIGPDAAVRVELLPPGDYPAAVWEAAATLLLRVTSGVRFVRAAGERNGSARLEVRFCSAPTPTELQAAVAALALAGHCTEEMAVLTREDAAAMYLAVCGIPETKGGDRTCQSLQQT
ncbi:MAG: hypothetical protein WBL61_09385 [Bryobacteraceae bacterium]